jgi:septin family protein
LVTVRELLVIQDYLRKDFEHEQIDIYDFGEGDDSTEDAESYKSMLPFCMVNSEEMAHEQGKDRQMGILVDNKRILGREFIWGIIDVQNPEHCAFDALTSIMFDTHLEDLREKTSEKFYETWRTRNLRNHKTSLFLPVDLKSILLED